jgi:hypothetical protein
MAVITWDDVGERQYEAGLDRGVLYFPEGGGVAWSGLTSLEESVSTKVESAYFDGLKYNDIVTIGDFAAKLRAITYPDEFLRFEGTLEDQTGVLVTGQPLQVFALSYRTRIGNDLTPNAGYKIHVLYNLTAVPSEVEHRSLSLETEPIEFEWDITAVPEEIETFRPTAHIILDSRRLDPYLMGDIEEFLYGNEDHGPRLPSLKGLTSYIRNWNRLIIIDNHDGTWTAVSNAPDIITMIDETTFEIESDSAVYLDADSYTLSSTEKNEGDLWLP